MDLFLAICQGLGLALAIGLGGAIAALFVSAMGSLATGIDADGTDYSFITATWFLVALLAVAVLAVLARGRASARIAVVGLLAAAGALAFAASLAEQGDAAWPGLVAGGLAAAAAALVATDVLEGALSRARAAGAGRGGVGRDSGDNAPTPEADAANVLIIGFAVAGVVLAVLALFVPPVSLLAALGLAILARRRRRKAGEKYEGLRILR